MNKPHLPQGAAICSGGVVPREDRQKAAACPDGAQGAQPSEPQLWWKAPLAVAQGRSASGSEGDGSRQLEGGSSAKFVEPLSNECAESSRGADGPLSSQGLGGPGAQNRVPKSEPSGSHRWWPLWLPKPATESLSSRRPNGFVKVKLCVKEGDAVEVQLLIEADGNQTLSGWTADLGGQGQAGLGGKGSSSGASAVGSWWPIWQAAKEQEGACGGGAGEHVRLLLSIKSDNRVLAELQVSRPGKGRPRGEASTGLSAPRIWLPWQSKNENLGSGSTRETVSICRPLVREDAAPDEVPAGGGVSGGTGNSSGTAEHGSKGALETACKPPASHGSQGAQGRNSTWWPLWQPTRGPCDSPECVQLKLVVTGEGPQVRAELHVQRRSSSSAAAPCVGPPKGEGPHGLPLGPPVRSRRCPWIGHDYPLRSSRA